jgi:hypothetical protein
MQFKPRRGPLVAAMLIPLALTSALLAAPARAQDPGTFTGNLTDSNTNEPIAGICVDAYEPGSDTPAGTGCSDAQGQFAIPGVADFPGYQLHTTAGAGYPAVWLDVRGGTPWRDTASRWGSGSWFSLRKGTLVSGTVLRADGTPAAGVSIDLRPIECCGGPYATSDDLGRWVVVAEPGDYTLSNELDFQYWYWQGQYDVGEADPIHVGDTALVLDQTVPARTTVTGTVRNSAGAPVAGICVSAADAGDPATRYGSACTGTTGAFQLTGIYAGTYLIQTSDDSGQYASVSSEPFTIANGQTISGIDLVVTGAGSLSGKVVDRITGQPIAGICPSAYAGRTGDYLPGQQGSCSDATGAWKITTVNPGPVTVRLEGDTTRLSRWAADAETQATATVYQVKQDATTATGTVRLYRGATLTGLIKAPNGTPLADAYVTLSGFPGRAGPGEGQYSTQTGRDGRYTIRNIPPGSLPALVYTDPVLPYASQWSGGATDPAKAAKLTFKYASTTTFNAMVKPEGKLKVTLRNGPTGIYTRVDAFTIPSQKPVGWAGDILGSGSGTLTGLPASSVKVRVQYNDEAGALHTTWYGGRSYAAATPVVVHQGATAAITVKAP